MILLLLLLLPWPSLGPVAACVCGRRCGSALWMYEPALGIKERRSHPVSWHMCVSAVCCCVCIRERDSVLLVPCGHLDVCIHCALALPRCPRCGRALTGCVAGRDYVDFEWWRRGMGSGCRRAERPKRGVDAGAPSWPGAAAAPP